MTFPQRYTHQQSIMPGYPISEADHLVTAETLMRPVTAVFENCGMSPHDAELLADTLIMADLRGCHSHGVLRVPEYVKKLTSDGVDPKGRPRIEQERISALVIDGDNAMGQIACAFAMQQAIERAAETGVAVAAVRGSNHCGAMAYFAMMPLAHDMIGLATTNALPTMAPWGGREKIVGINPLSIAVPADREHPVVLDAAFSGSSHGKIRVYHQKGHPIPEDWAFDSQGVPTTDPAAAIEGLLQPIGGYKGVGMAVMMGILSSVLSGASYGTELGNMEEGPQPGGDGQFLMALNVAAFEDPRRFKERVDGIVHQIRQSARTAGCETLYAPGGLEAESEARHRQRGIPLSAPTVEGLLQCASKLGVEPGELGQA